MIIGPNDIVSPPRQLTDNRSLVVAHTIQADEKEEYNCTVSKTHRTNILVEKIEVELRGRSVEIKDRKVVVEIELKAREQVCARGQVVAVKLPGNSSFHID